MSSDAKSFFTSIPLNKTVKITLKLICGRKEISTDIPKTIIKEMLLLCTKDVHFSFEDKIYQKTDGVAMRPSLGPIPDGIFMVELGTEIVPALGLIYYVNGKEMQMRLIVLLKLIV